MSKPPATPQQKPQNNESQEHDYFFSEISPTDRRYLDEPRQQVDPCVWCGGRLLHADLCVTNSDEFQPKLGFGEHKTKSVRDVPQISSVGSQHGVLDVDHRDDRSY